MPKLSYRIGLKPKIKLSGFFGPAAEKVDNLVFKASWPDPLFVREQLVYRAMRQMGGLAPRSNLAELFVNGECVATLAARTHVPL